MTVRVTTSQRPIVAASFLPPHGAPQTIEWRFKSLRNQFVRDLWRQCTGSRRLAREQRIAAQEEDWLRLTAMSDGQVVGLEPRLPPRQRGAVAAACQSAQSTMARKS